MLVQSLTNVVHACLFCNVYNVFSVLSLQVFTLAESLGGYESLAELP